MISILSSALSETLMKEDEKDLLQAYRMLDKADKILALSIVKDFVSSRTRKIKSTKKAATKDIAHSEVIGTCLMNDNPLASFRDKLKGKGRDMIGDSNDIEKPKSLKTIDPRNL